MKYYLTLYIYLKYKFITRFDILFMILVHVLKLTIFKSSFIIYIFFIFIV